MKIRDAIVRLQDLMNAHGPDTPVYFDCPTCGISFTPEAIATQAIHLKGEKKGGK